MNHYRISKYNPIYRINNIYTKNEWTSIADIGTEFDNNVFRWKEYVSVEKNYLLFIEKIIEQLKISKLYILNLEIYNLNKWKNNQQVDKNSILEFSRDCLREKCWGKLVGEKIYIHFGYDFYMYMGTPLKYEVMNNVAQSCHVYCEEYRSPYL